MKHIREIFVKAALFLFVAAFFAACSPEKKEADKKEEIALFVPGILSEAPSYRMFVEGCESYVKENAKDAKLKVIEAGMNQGEWLTKLFALASEKKYSLILTSNPSMPDLIKTVSEQFGEQKFIVIDAKGGGLKNLYTISYARREAAYVAGFVASLSSKSGQIALFSGQDYPVMKEILFPSFTEGAKAAKGECKTHFAVTGSWSDVSKGEALASSFILKGIDVILPITGGAANGVIHEAEKKNARLVWFDEDGSAKSPDFIVGSIVIRHDKMARSALEKFFSKRVPWGESDSFGMKDGFSELKLNEKVSRSVLSDDAQNKISSLINSLKSGELNLEEN